MTEARGRPTLHLSADLNSTYVTLVYTTSAVSECLNILAPNLQGDNRRVLPFSVVTGIDDSAGKPTLNVSNM